MKREKRKEEVKSMKEKIEDWYGVEGWITDQPNLGGQASNTLERVNLDVETPNSFFIHKDSSGLKNKN